MELASLRAPRPIPPRLSAGDKRVHIILRDLEKIKYTKPKKQLKRCHNLIFYITQVLRKAEHDHLLHSTAIWVLINIFRLFPEGTKPVMLEAGVPGVLFEIIRNSSISGTSRQYASELCFYLSSNHPYPEQKDLPALGAPIKQFPEIQVINRYQGELDDVSIASDLSSVLNEDRSKPRQPFVPYRINDANLAKIEALFEEGYDHQVAASLPNHHLLSQFGFTQFKKKQAADLNYYDQKQSMKKMLGQGERQQQDGHDDSDDSGSDSSDDDFGNIEDPGNDDSHAGSGYHIGMKRSASQLHSNGVGGREDDDATSVMSTLSSGSRSKPPSVYQDMDNAVMTPNLKSAAMMGLHTNKGALHSLVKEIHKDESLMSQPGANLLLSKSQEVIGQQKRPKTTTFAESSTRASNGAPLASPFRLGKIPRMDINDGDCDDEDQLSVNSNQSNSWSKGGISEKSGFPPSSPLRSNQPNVISSAPHRAIHQLRQESSLYRTSQSASSGLRPGQQEPSTAYDSWVSKTKLIKPNSNGGLAAFQGAGFGEEPPPQVVKKPMQKFSDGFVSSSNMSMTNRSVASFSSTLSPGKAAAQTMTSTSTDLNEFLSALDPLALNVKASLQSHLNVKSIADDIDAAEQQDEENYWEDSDEDNTAYGLRVGREFEEEEDDNNEDGSQNPYLQQRKLRMRAEKLIDHTFVKSLFLKKTNLQDSQDLIHRMEQLLMLLDPQDTGYVTFEQFTRLILAVAPKHLLRADILNFMQAQTKNMDDFVDYREFIISGKVLLLTKAQHLQKTAESMNARLANEKLPKGAKEAFSHRTETSSTAVWLKRQKQYVGNPSTYTWKNHLRWYSTRKAQAVIWLVRRATRAFDHEKRLEEAQRFLLIQRKQAIAKTELMTYGYAALQAKDFRIQAKRRLLTRVIRARKHIQRVQEAQFFLVYTAKGALKEMQYVDKINSLREQSRLAALQAAAEEEGQQNNLHSSPKKKKKADYATLFKIRELQKLAIQFFHAKAKKALAHCAKQDEALSFIRHYVNKVQTQFIMKDRARRELLLRAEAAYRFCLLQDQAWLGLNRLGAKAFSLIERQEKCAAWLKEKGQSSIQFVGAQSTTLVDLVTIGRRTLSFMNAREQAFAYLVKRKEKSERFVVRKAEAVEFLRNRPKGLWEVYDRMNETQAWLCQRAQQAKEYAKVRAKAAQFLQFIAGKATRTYRKTYIAHQELCQIGLLARVRFFRQTYTQEPLLVQLVKDEVKKIKKRDKLHYQERKLWPLELRLKVELAEAFEVIHSMYTPTALTMKTAIQRLEFVTKSTPAAVSRLPSRPNTSTAGTVYAIEDANHSPLLLTPTAHSTSRPGTSSNTGNVNSLILGSPMASRPHTSAGLITTTTPGTNNHTNVHTNSQSHNHTNVGSKVPSRPGSSAWQTRPGTSGGLLPMMFSGQASRPQTADSEAAAAATIAAGNTSTTKYYIGRYAFRRLVNYGKVLNLDVVAVDEFFRNIDYNAFCYITLQDVYPWFKKKALKIKGFQFKVSDVLSVEERALIAIFLRFLNEKDLLGLPPKKKKRKNKYEEAMNKYSEAKKNGKRNYYESEEESSDDEVEEEDEDALFSNLDKLKNCDIGRLMRYLTRKKELELQAQRLREEQSKQEQQQLALEDDFKNTEPQQLAVEGEGQDEALELPNMESLHLDSDVQKDYAIKEGFEPPAVEKDWKGKDI